MASDIINKVKSLENRKVEYDGKKYNRTAVSNISSHYRERHQNHINDLKTLREEHDKLSKEMAEEIESQRSFIDEIKTMASGKQGGVSRGFKGVLSKIPFLGRKFRRRSLSDLLETKVEIADLRVRKVNSFLSKVEETIDGLRSDLEELHSKQIEAASKKKEFVEIVLELKQVKEELQQEIEKIEDQNTPQYREMEAALTNTDRLIWDNGQKMRLFDNAQTRLESVIKMNKNFLEISQNLHSNMTIIYESAQTVLDELRQHVSRIATLAEAGELSLDLASSMESLKISMSKVAQIASETSLYLTRNVEDISSNMRIYDQITEDLVEKNLAEERELRKQQLENILDKAEQEDIKN